MAPANSSLAAIHTVDEDVAGDVLLDRIRRVATGLRALGVGQGDCVSLLLRNDVPFLVASAAAQMLGAYAVPLNWHFKRDELLYVISDSAPKVLIAHSDLLDIVVSGLPSHLAVIEVAVPPALGKAFRAAGTAISRPGMMAWAEFSAQWSPDALPAAPAADSVIYTSRTTVDSPSRRAFRARSSRAISPIPISPITAGPAIAPTCNEEG